MVVCEFSNILTQNSCVFRQKPVCLVLSLSSTTIIYPLPQPKKEKRRNPTQQFMNRNPNDFFIIA